MDEKERAAVLAWLLSLSDEEFSLLVSRYGIQENQPAKEPDTSMLEAASARNQEPQPEQKQA